MEIVGQAFELWYGVFEVIPENYGLFTQHTQYFGHLMQRTGKDPDAGQD